MLCYELQTMIDMMMIFLFSICVHWFCCGVASWLSSSCCPSSRPSCTPSSPASPGSASTSTRRARRGTWCPSCGTSSWSTWSAVGSPAITTSRRASCGVRRDRRSRWEFAPDTRLVWLVVSVNIQLVMISNIYFLCSPDPPGSLLCPGLSPLPDIQHLSSGLSL